MVLFNYATRELTAKIVYYGPGLCGKTTNLQFVYEQLPEDVKGKMLSLATKTDRTLFFDFLPMDLGEIRGMKTRVQLYTVPGQVFYNETRKLVLKGADGVVFVADSQEQMMASNIESLRNLEENLKAHGMKLSEIPHVFQFNKRDLPRLSSLDEINAGLNKHNAPFFEAVATTGIGVQDTLKGIAKLVLVNLTRRYQPKSTPAVASERTAPPAIAGVGSGSGVGSQTGTALPRAANPHPSVDGTAQVPRSGSVPLSPARVQTFSPTTAPAPPPSVLVGTHPRVAADQPAGIGSFGEIEIDEMVESLQGADEAAPLTVDSEWDDARLDAGHGAFSSGQEKTYFLGEPEEGAPDPLSFSEMRHRGIAPSSTRLIVGETSDVVVPVEIQEGESLRRFRLTVRLRLEPAD